MASPLSSGDGSAVPPAGPVDPVVPPVASGPAPPAASDPAPPVGPDRTPPIRPARVPPVAPDPAPPARQLPAGTAGVADQAGDLLGQAQTWIEQNQTVAMAAAFALGTFLGIRMRR